eukprot:5530472-Alexandrium_andersonii.AAC.1
MSLRATGRSEADRGLVTTFVSEAQTSGGDVPVTAPESETTESAVPSEAGPSKRRRRRGRSSGPPVQQA